MLMRGPTLLNGRNLRRESLMFNPVRSLLPGGESYRSDMLAIFD